MANVPQRPPEAGAPGPGEWRRIHLWHIQAVRDLLVLGALVGLIYLGYVLRVVTVPIMLAIALAYLFEPLVARATARAGWLSRPGMAVTIIVSMTLLVVAPATVGVGFAVVQGTKVVGRLADNVQVLLVSVDQPADPALRVQLPGQTWKNLRDYIVEQEELRKAQQQRRGLGAPPRTTDQVPGPQADGHAPPVNLDAPYAAPSPAYELVQSALVWLRENKERIGQTALRSGGEAVRLAGRIFGSAAGFLFGAFLTAFFFYFFCTGHGRVLEFWYGLIPERRKGRVVDLLLQMDRVIAGFVRGRVTICAVLMVYYSVAYWLIGVPAPLILGPIVGILSIIPYAAGLGVPVAMLLMALDPGTGWQAQWWWIIGSPLLVHGLAQVLDDYVMTPAIQGKTTNMDTPTILFASLAGGVLGGIYGLLLAIPVAACLKIILREVFWPRFRQWAEGRAKDILPIGPG